MRFEIDVDDERPEAQILRDMSDPSTYVLELVRADQDRKALRAEKAPRYHSRIFADGQICPSAFKTREEVDRCISHLRDEW